MIIFRVNFPTRNRLTVVRRLQRKPILPGRWMGTIVKCASICETLEAASPTARILQVMSCKYSRTILKLARILVEKDRVYPLEEDLSEDDG